MASRSIVAAIVLLSYPICAQAQLATSAQEIAPNSNIAWALGNQQTGEPAVVNGKQVRLEAISASGDQAAISLWENWGMSPSGIGWILPNSSVVIPVDGTTQQPFSAEVLCFTWRDGGLAYTAGGNAWWWTSQGFVGPDTAITLAEHGGVKVGQSNGQAFKWQDGRMTFLSQNQGSSALAVLHSRTWDTDTVEVVGNDPKGVGPFYYFVGSSGLNQSTPPLSATGFHSLASHIQNLPVGVTLRRIVWVSQDMQRIVCTALVPTAYGKSRTALYELVRIYPY